MCIVRYFQEFHNNVVIRATYTYILPNEKYRKYRAIIVSKPKILCNIVWTLKKDIAEGWSQPKKNESQSQQLPKILFGGSPNLHHC